MTSTPTLNGQVLGQAERATRALLEKLLAGTGSTFAQWVSVNGTATAGGTVPRAALARQMVNGLKLSEQVVAAEIDGALAAGLLAADADSLALTTAGRERWEEVSAGIATITAQLYGDLPAEDLATAGRVLAIVTERANAQLAA